MSNYKDEIFGFDTKRRNYQKSKNDLEIPNLLEIQTNSFKKFLEVGIDEVFKEIYPIHSSKSKIIVDYLKCSIKLPKDYDKAIREAKTKGTNFSATIKASFRMTNNLTGEVKEDNSVFIANLPIMTSGGSFIINGSERIIISQIIRSPGVYFENFKATRTQSQSSLESSILKLATIIPNRGAWIEWDYKDYSLLDIESQDIKLKIDKSKKLKAALLFYAFGLDENICYDLFGKHELIVNSFDKLTKKEKSITKAKEIIYKSINNAIHSSERTINDFFANIFFNKKRYDLSPTGRYKLNKKLSFITRIIDRILAEDILDISGNVIFKKGKKIVFDDVQLLEEKNKNNEIMLTNLNFDSTIFETLGMENFNKRKLFSQVVQVKVYANENWEEESNPKIISVIGNCYSNEFDGLTISDIIASFSYFVNLEQGLSSYDDIDSLVNRKIRTTDELLRNQFRIGLVRIEKNLRDRISAKDTSEVTIKSVTNYKVMESTLKEFFNTSQLSQFMDQVNPLAEISNKRRLTSLGPRGLSRDTASLIVRGIHDTHYGRIDPIETPEGPNIGLILSLALYAKVNQYGLIETPFFEVKNGKVNYKNPIFVAAEDEYKYIIASGATKVNDNNEIVETNIVARKNGKFITTTKDKISLIDVSSKQIVSLATSHIPFLENNDANRALMGANMQRQAVSLLIPDAPIVATGMEKYSGYYAPGSLKSPVDGKVIEVDAKNIVIEDDNNKKHKLLLDKFVRSNQASSITQTPLIKEGAKVKVGDLLADGPAIKNGELAIGKNVLIAFTTWRGFNYEDAIVLSERLVKEDVFTSIHIEEHKIEQRNIKLGDEKITRDLPNVSKESIRNLDENGIIIIGSEVKVGDILVGKITPKGEEDLSLEEKLLDAILGVKLKNTRDNSLRVPYGQEGIVQDVKILSTENGDKLDDGVLKLIKVYIVQKRKIKEGDKMSGRHGNKGVVSRILPIEDMPHLEDGTPIDVMLNPLGVPSRMNLGQVFEIHLGMAAKLLGIKVATPIFNGANLNDLIEIMKESKISSDGKFTLVDGITGEKFKEKVAVGVMYMLKLSHMVDDKMHARSIGPYSLITQQPLRGKSQNGGQRFGEMEAWALEAYGASNLLQEMMTLKSDDIHGRNELYNAIVKGKKIPEPSITEAFWVLYYELRGLGLNFEFIDENNQVIELENSI